MEDRLDSGLMLVLLDDMLQVLDTWIDGARAAPS